MLGVFRQCHTRHIFGHTRHAGFSGIEKNEPSCDIILLGIKAYRDFRTYIRLTQKSCPKFVTHVTQLHE